MTRLGLLGSVILAMAACGDPSRGGDETNDAPVAGDAASDGRAVDALVTIDGAVDASPPGPAVFTVEGMVGSGAPASGRVIVFWVVSSGSPDYVYKFGEGASTGPQFIASFSAVPPAAAINSYGVGVGIVGLLSPTATLPPDGIVNSELDIVGFTRMHAVIYRNTTATPLPWIAPFAQGYSCGRCVEQGTGFDIFEPVACSSVLLSLAQSGPVCNWT